jgi:hypothetical protein
MTSPRVYLFLNLVALAFLGYIHLWGNLDQMSSNWTGPYYSGSANLELGGKFMVCESDIYQYNKLDKDALEKKFVFSPCQESVYYNHNPVGYCYLLKISRTFFGYLGDLNAAIVLQILFYFLCSYLLFQYVNVSNTVKILLFILFFLNPFVLRFTAFNFYYFWFIIPVFLSFVYITKSKLPLYLDFLLFILVSIIFSFRPTFLIIVPTILILSYYQLGLKNALIKVAILITVLLVCFQPAAKNFYHTATVGIGAYPNHYNITLSDDDAYQLYFIKTGEKLNASYGGNYYDPKTLEVYKEITQEYFLKYIQEYPLEFFRNALLNTGLAFSSGYITSLPYYAKVLLSVLGWLLLVLLLVNKEYLIPFLILANSATIVLYYPPIPAYILGNYLLLAYGVLILLEKKFIKGYTVSLFK